MTDPAMLVTLVIDVKAWRCGARSGSASTGAATAAGETSAGTDGAGDTVPAGPEAEPADAGSAPLAPAWIVSRAPTSAARRSTVADGAGDGGAGPGPCEGPFSASNLLSRLLRRSISLCSAATIVASEASTAGVDITTRSLLDAADAPRGTPSCEAESAKPTLSTLALRAVVLIDQYAC